MCCWSLVGLRPRGCVSFASHANVRRPRREQEIWPLSSAARRGGRPRTGGCETRWRAASPSRLGQALEASRGMITIRDADCDASPVKRHGARGPARHCVGARAGASRPAVVIPPLSCDKRRDRRRDRERASRRPVALAGRAQPRKHDVGHDTRRDCPGIVQETQKGAHAGAAVGDRTARGRRAPDAR